MGKELVTGQVNHTDRDILQEASITNHGEGRKIASAARPRPTRRVILADEPGFRTRPRTLHPRWRAFVVRRSILTVRSSKTTSNSAAGGH